MPQPVIAVLHVLVLLRAGRSSFIWQAFNNVYECICFAGRHLLQVSAGGSSMDTSQLATAPASGAPHTPDAVHGVIETSPPRLVLQPGHCSYLLRLAGKQSFIDMAKISQPDNVNPCCRPPPARYADRRRIQQQLQHGHLPVSGYCSLKRYAPCRVGNVQCGSPSPRACRLLWRCGISSSTMMQHTNVMGPW